ncbi:MAG: M3 family metallopeptidase [Muribaculaceae bacterium]|nr:M3 family metallopeptidase [Muribaculaceae bacterium]MDE6510351.1 M3 family metallopeptidase [Muribaculaceae bacterium]
MIDNPLLRNFDTPPFSEIQTRHFGPAIDKALQEARADIDAITSCADKPTFANTIEAYERSGELLDRVLGVFYPLLSANADDEMMDLSIEVSAKLSEYSSDVSLNPRLFARIKTVYDSMESLSGLTPEQKTLLSDTYIGFTRSGALLDGSAKERFRQVSARISELTTRFGQNVKKELATYRIVIDNPEELRGIPPHITDEAAELANSAGMPGKWILTLDQPVYTEVLKLADNRPLREKAYRLYSARNTAGQYSNAAILTEIAELRLEMARLLGHQDFASYKLERTMAQTPEQVYGLLDRLRDAYTPALHLELKQIEEFAGEKPQPWDYSYQFNRLRRKLHDFDPEELRPYFELNRVIDGVFSLANRLYGINFTPADNVDVYHPDVKAFRVTDADGSPLGLLYADFFPRSGRKSPGAWMTEFREADATHRPLVNIVMNFTRPSADRPSLLSPAEVNTFLHEFGHSLHSLLSRCRYSSLAGTNVRRDFVELPSQFMENFLDCKEFIHSFAVHYLTGEPMPDRLLERMKAARQFGAAYACIRQLSFGYLDMAWHTISAPVSDPAEFERKATAAVTPIPTPESAVTSTSFGHIFAGGYAAGYYSYKWAEVLDADAFAMFEQMGPFSGEPARRFRHEILERGGSEHPAELYRRFRGHDATIDALLRRDGIKA